MNEQEQEADRRAKLVTKINVVLSRLEAARERVTAAAVAEAAAEAQAAELRRMRIAQARLLIEEARKETHAAVSKILNDARSERGTARAELERLNDEYNQLLQRLSQLLPTYVSP